MEGSNLRSLLENIECMCETSQDGILVMRQKPELFIYDSTETCFWVNDDTNKMYFEFMEDELEEFSIDINTINSIKFEKQGKLTVSSIYLQDGQMIMIYTNK